MPESPIRHSGWPARTQSQEARWDGAGLMAGLAVEVEVVEPLGAGEAGVVDPADGAAVVAVVALGHQQLGEEPAVGQLLAFGGGGDGRPNWVADGRQPQDAAGWSMAASAACSVIDRRRVLVLVMSRFPCTACFPVGARAAAGQQLVVSAHRRRRR